MRLLLVLLMYSVMVFANDAENKCYDSCKVNEDKYGAIGYTIDEDGVCRCNYGENTDGTLRPNGDGTYSGAPQNDAVPTESERN